jgi:anti-sigma factor RsiW
VSPRGSSSSARASGPQTAREQPAGLNPRGARQPWLQRTAGIRTRVAPFAAAASLVLIVGAAFLYQLTSSSNRVMAAELAADHVKCFALNGILHTHDDAATVESSMVSGFGWNVHLPDPASTAGLELVGSRPCLYGEGKIAHIMYRHNGQPVSLFMLPRTARTEEFVQVLGHEAAIWCARDRTFVLVAHEPKADVQRMVSAVQAALNR